MLAKTLVSAAILGLSALIVAPSFAADNPLAPAYTTSAQKKYFMEFCKIDLNSDGMVSMEEYLNHGNPLAPGFDKNPKFTAKIAEWKAMAGDSKDISADKFVAYMDTRNPLSPSHKK